MVRPPRVDGGRAGDRTPEKPNTTVSVVNTQRIDNANNDVPPTRVLRPRTKVHQQKYARGTRVYRIFGEPNRLVQNRGFISDFDKEKGYYNVKYQDGDNEEYTTDEIGTILHKTKRNNNIMRALAATKHERIIEGYATMETIYTPPSQYSGGYSKAMECVEMMALEAVGEITPQG